MVTTIRRIKTQIKVNGPKCLRCGAKTITFLFWATSYMVAMKMTVFKGNSPEQSVKDTIPDNASNTDWLHDGSDVIEDTWTAPDNSTILELEDRAANVQRVCRQRSINQSINSKEFFVDHKHNLVWCNIFKAASSSWLHKFNILGGRSRILLDNSRRSPLELARSKFPRPSEDEVRDAVNTPGVVSLLVVRDPFVRILSAFRDKLEVSPPPYYRNMAKKMVTRKRKKPNQITSRSRTSGPTFVEFVTFLVNKHKDKGFTFDEHWAPYYKFCSPCAVNFSVIAKVETLARDSAYVIHELGLGHVLAPGPRRRPVPQQFMNKSRDGRNTTALLKYYFSQLDQKLFDGLLEIYGIDFDMFGYDANVYKKFIKK